MYLLDKEDFLILDNGGFPLLYQVVAVYRDKSSASLVNAYGDYVGVYPLDKIEYVSEGPLFGKKDYDIGDTIIWVDGEDVYEGEIKSLYNTHTKVVNIKKLMPVGRIANVPYWKISDKF